MFEKAQAIAPTAVTEDASDAELASAAQADPRAFGALFVRHRGAVYRFLRLRVSTDDEAADLTALTFERAFGAIGRYRAPDRGGPLPWLLRIARNAAVDEARKRRPARRLDEIGPDEHPTSPLDPEATALEAEDVERLRALVRALPDAQRDAVVLRYANRLPAREIAPVIGKSPAATEKLLQRALAVLREAYDAND